MTKRGKFITFEGCDGCGKSTQLKMFSAYLTQNHIPHLFTREPGGGKISEAIREILLNGINIKEYNSLDIVKNNEVEKLPYRFRPWCGSYHL